MYAVLKKYLFIFIHERPLEYNVYNVLSLHLLTGSHYYTVFKKYLIYIYSLEDTAVFKVPDNTTTQCFIFSR